MAKRKKDEDQENASGANEGDNFGLPDIEYKPLDRTETVSESEQSESSASESVQEQVSETSEQTQTQYEYVPPVEERSKAPVVISIVIGLVLILSGFFIYYYVYKPKAEKEKQEQIEAARKKAEAQRLAKLKAEEEERKRREAEQAAKNAKPAEGTIETLNARTGRWYVVVTSSIDGDLVMDYAKKQSAKGISSKIIPPYGKWKFHRLAIADYDTFALAQAGADAAKTEYGSGVWVIKY